MTDSLGEVRARLAEIAENVGRAREHVDVAGARITDAIGVLKGLSEQHEESLVPRELLKASDEISRCSGLINGSAQKLSDIQARM